MSHLPTTREVLGEHLYSVIQPLQPDYADKLTGMLLELGNEEVVQLLQYSDLLRKRIDTAMEVLQQEESQNKDMLGEKLYARVEEIEPVFCSKITGMLLEMDSHAIHHLLLSTEALHGAIHKAKLALSHEHSGVSDSDYHHGGDREKLGELLYNIIAEEYPQHSAKITGMLLELNQSDLVELLNNNDMLQSKVKVAVDVIEKECNGR
ncbi:uncharacterized protein LOC144441161 [Glandiceps talaboti]